MSFTRGRFWQLLRDAPQGAPAVVSQTSESRDGYVIERLRLRLERGEEIRGIVVRPAAAAGRLPAILYMHSHGGHYEVGADELLDGGDAGSPRHVFAPQLDLRLKRDLWLCCVAHAVTTRLFAPLGTVFRDCTHVVSRVATTARHWA